MTPRSSPVDGVSNITAVKSSPSAHAPEHSAWETAAFVWGIWGFLLAVALVFVFQYAENAPFIDDWAVVPYITGARPVTLGYLWEQHNEHRIPLPKLLLVVLSLFSEGYFRVGPYVNVLLLAGLALGMLRVVRRLRGRLSYTDAFFPLVVLSIGHYENLLWTWQIQFILSSVLIGSLFLVLIGRRGPLSTRSGLLFGAGLVLLPLCGGQGLPYTVLLGGWLAWIGMRRLVGGRPGERAAGWAMVALATTALALVGLYYVGYQKNPGDYAAALAPTLPGMVQTTLELWSISLGTAVQHDYSPNFTWPVSWVLVGVTILSCIGGLAISWYKNSSDRERIVGLGLFLLAVVGLSVAMGWTRAAGEGHWEGHGFQPRYTTLMMPLMYGTYFACTLLRSGKRRGLAQMVLFTLVCSLSIHNIAVGVEFGKKRSQAAQAFLADLAQGEPVYRLARRHARPLGFEVDQQLVADYLRLLRRAGFEPYRDLKEDPPFLEVGLPLQPVDVVGMTWSPPSGQVTANDAYLTFALKEPRFVAGVQVTIAYPHPAAAARAEPAVLRSSPQGESPGTLPPPWTRKGQIVPGLVPRLQVSWKTSEQSDFVDMDWWASTQPRWDEERYLMPGTQEQTVTIWVGDTIDQFRIFPDKPLRIWGDPQGQLGPPIVGERSGYEFTISSLKLLIPLEGG